MDKMPEISNKPPRPKKMAKKSMMLVPSRREESPQPGPSTTKTRTKASTTVTTIIKPSIPFSSGSESETDEETVYNYLKVTPSGLLMRPKSAELIQYIRAPVLVKIAELLSEFSFDDHSTPIAFMKVNYPKLKGTMPQADLDILLHIFYLSLDRNDFLVGVQHLFLESKSAGRSEYWNVEGAHHFEVLITIIFFLASQLEPENLVEILTKSPWKGIDRFYKFILKQRSKRKGGQLMKLVKKEFAAEFIKTNISPNLKATRHIIRKIVYPPKEKSTIQLPPSLHRITHSRLDVKDKNEPVAPKKSAQVPTKPLVRIKSVGKTLKFGETVPKLNKPLEIPNLLQARARLLSLTAGKNWSLKPRGATNRPTAFDNSPWSSLAAMSAGFATGATNMMPEVIPLKTRVGGSPSPKNKKKPAVVVAEPAALVTIPSAAKKKPKVVDADAEPVLVTDKNGPGVSDNSAAESGLEGSPLGSTPSLKMLAAVAAGAGLGTIVTDRKVPDDTAMTGTVVGRSPRGTKKKKRAMVTAEPDTTVALEKIPDTSGITSVEEERKPIGTKEKKVPVVPIALDTVGTEEKVAHISGVAGTESGSKPSRTKGKKVSVVTSGLDTVGTKEKDSKLPPVQGVTKANKPIGAKAKKPPVVHTGLQTSLTKRKLPEVPAVQFNSARIWGSPSGTKVKVLSRPFSASARSARSARSAHTLQHRTMFLPFPFPGLPQSVKTNTMTVEERMANIMQIKKLDTIGPRPPNKK